MCARELDISQDNRHLEGLLDTLLSMKSDDAVVHIRVVDKLPADKEIARRPALEHLGVLDLLRTRRQRAPRATRDQPSCP